MRVLAEDFIILGFFPSLMRYARPTEAQGLNAGYQCYMVGRDLAGMNYR